MSEEYQSDNQVKYDRPSEPAEKSPLKWPLLFFIILAVLSAGGLFGYAYYKNGNFKVMSVLRPAAEEGRPAPADPIAPVNDKAINTDQADCVTAGGIITPDTTQTDQSTACCFGLKLVLVDRPDSLTEAYCVDCGNGICEPPESNANCPIDCPSEIVELSPEELALDSDNDGLKDFEETWYGTDPYSADTDNDGYSDGDELKLGYSPIGDGMIAADFSTPEGAVITMEQARADCRLAEMRERLYWSDSFFDFYIYMILEDDMNAGQNKTKDELIADFKNKLMNDFLDSTVYVNAIKNIIFDLRRPLNASQVYFHYRVAYEPDNRDYVPLPDVKPIALTRINNEWRIDLGATIRSGMDDLDSALSKSRDARRVADIKQIQTAAELYYNNARRYPDTIKSGEPIVYDKMIYMHAAPSNPPEADGPCPANFEYKYTAKDEGESYEIEYCLGATVGRIPAGHNTATQRTISNKQDSRLPQYKDCSTGSAIPPPFPL